MNRVSVVQADITTLEVDAIVNAANERMLGGGGVDGAIHRAAGPELREACRAVPEVRRGVRCPTGKSRITPGFRLPARYVIHTVGPVWRGGNAGESALLERCYLSSLELASQYDLKSIAFPAISCGAFGYPLAEAAMIARKAIARFLETDRSVEQIVLVAFDADVRTVLEDAFARTEARPT